MFPIRDHNPSGKTPFVTYALIVINILVFLSYFPGNSIAYHSAFFDIWALVPAEVIAGESLITLLTCMFLHGSWMHIGGNMLFLYIFGDNLESRMGHAQYLGFYLLSGLAASALQIYADTDSLIPNVGASGAIAGVMGGYLLLYPKAKVDVFMIMGVMTRMQSMPAYVMLGYWFVLQVISGVGTIGNSGGGVAYWAHAGGFIAGVAIAFFYKNPSDTPVRIGNMFERK